MIEQRVTLRYGAQQIPAIVQAVQGDTGRDVIFELADYEIPAGATANYYIDKPDDTAIYNSAEVISSTEILAHLTEQALAAPGRNNGQVRILSDGEVITSFDFVLEVEAFRGILRLQSGTEVNIFDQAIEDAATEAIAEAVDEIQAQTPAVTGMQNSIAPTYSSSSIYDVGNYVMYNAKLYRCKTAITTPEAWTAAHWSEIPISIDVESTKKAALSAGIFDLTDQMNHYNANYNGITYAWSNGKCKITGTATAVSYNNLFISTNSLPPSINAGDVLRVKYSATNASLIFYDYSNGNISLIKEIKRDAIIKIPDNCTGLIVRLWVGNGTTINETVHPRVYTNHSCCIEPVDVATQSESGKTDMKPVIQDMLDIYGYCKLGSGSYYISGAITLPYGSKIEGCGESTELRLMSGNGKAAVMMRKYSSLSDLSIIGNYDDLTESDFGPSSGSRYGVQFYKGSGDTYETAYCSITNVHIRNFTGAGIYQYGTGANVEQGLFVTNVHIKNCWCGIWVYANSEFCRYSNVQITYCYIACINNGGNNAFDNCVFHAYSIGMKIDGTQNNSAHGMCSNSSFCHTGGNVGSALTLGDIVNGFVFSACQFWYNSVDITSCGGIVFDGCEFGRGTTGAGATINIDGGNTVMFASCVFMNDVTYPPVINISSNNKVKFNACYGSVSGNEISAA